MDKSTYALGGHSKCTCAHGGEGGSNIGNSGTCLLIE